MTPAELILIVEDEAALARIMGKYLEQAGYRVEILAEGTEAVEIVLKTRPALVVLDLMLPGKDGLTICRELRAKSDVPIIMETARVEEIDRLLGLELGADDYLCKPFSPRELVARVRAILRRARPQQLQPHREDAVRLDEAGWHVLCHGVDIGLTRREFQLFAVMHRHPGRVYSRAQLLDLAFPDDSSVFDRTIDSHVRNIRAKARAVQPEWEPIRSVYGVGYAYEEME